MILQVPGKRDANESFDSPDRDEIGSRVPAGTKVFLWEVPSSSDDDGKYVGLGVSDDEKRARTAVEETMNRWPERSLCGVIQGPRMSRWRCRRGHRGGFVWTQEKLLSSRTLS